MPNIAYNISLKCYVGGLDFDRSSTKSLGSAEYPQFGIISLWISLYGRTLTDIKSDPDMIEKFAEGMNTLIRQILGQSLAPGD